MKDKDVLTVHDIINNIRDELTRSRELLQDNEDAINSYLIDDIDSSLDRLWDLEAELSVIYSKEGV